MAKLLSAAESAGFEVHNVEHLRQHSMLTLRHWAQRLESNHEAALEFVSEPTYRGWRLYMAVRARSFAQGRMPICETLRVKPYESGAACLPLTRNDWYRL